MAPKSPAMTPDERFNVTWIRFLPHKNGKYGKLLDVPQNQQRKCASEAATAGIVTLPQGL
jgi:hypothetical protein